MFFYMAMRVLPAGREDLGKPVSAKKKDIIITIARAWRPLNTVPRKKMVNGEMSERKSG